MEGRAVIGSNPDRDNERDSAKCFRLAFRMQLMLLCSHLLLTTHTMATCGMSAHSAADALAVVLQLVVRLIVHCSSDHSRAQRWGCFVFVLLAFLPLLPALHIWLTGVACSDEAASCYWCERSSDFRTVLFVSYPIVLFSMGFPFTISILMLLKLVSLLAFDVALDSAEVYLTAVPTAVGAFIGQSFVSQMHSMQASHASLVKQLERSTKSARTADSRLNHVLKNKSVEVCFLVRETMILLQGMVDLGDGLVSNLKAKSESMSRTLDHMQEWVHRREVFMQLANGTYASRSTIVSLGDLLRNMASGDVDINLSCPDVINTDVNMLLIQLEEALSNARKYRLKGSKLWLNAKMEVVEGRVWLKVSLTNANQDGIPVMTAEQCAAAFELGNRNVHCTSGHVSDTGVADQLSNGVGLDSVKAACRVTGGTVSLRGYLGSDEVAYTVFSLTQPAQYASEIEEKLFRSTMKPTTNFEANTESRPPPLCVGVDDSEILRGALMATFKLMGAARGSCAMGKTTEELDSCADVVMSMQADIVVLDQNLDCNSAPYTKGTIIAAQLRERGFDGLIVIYSGASLTEMAEIGKCV